MRKLQSNIKKYLPYLEDIQRRFYQSTIIIVTVFFLGIFSSGFFIRKFVQYFSLSNVTIATTSPFQFADVAVDIGFFCALIVALPLFIYHLLSFIHTALDKQELLKIIYSIPISFLLFVIGFSYGFVILFYSFSFLAVINEQIGIKNIWDISLYLSQIILTSTLLGMVFQFPLIISLLVRVNVITTEQLRSKRRLTVLLLFILVALLPPTDGLSLIAMALPLYLLYEGTIFIN